jgi:hypothetical protein
MVTLIYVQSSFHDLIKVLVSEICSLLSEMAGLAGLPGAQFACAFWLL